MADILSPAELNTLPKTNSLTEQPESVMKRKAVVIERRIKFMPVEN
tara:strand:- start:393 stop:530 length:138 start_codon:yes stop_codon:yes gene_type:complete